MGSHLARLPGAFQLMPQELRRLSGQECQARLSAEGKTPVDGQGAEALRKELEDCLGGKFCRLFFPSMAAAFLAYLLLATLLPSDAYALAALVLPAPSILLLRGLSVRRGNKASVR
mmetsp:Transcript_17227/g.40493  ORF Transcript_17227/g.40493 Transcript_17227/m.40493 type:complete len:116 (-) Transcript_17227:118-465(-)